MSFLRKKRDKNPSPPPAAAPPPATDAPGDSTFFTGDSVQDRRNVEILLETIAKVNSPTSPQETLRSIVDGAVALTKTERGILFLFDANAKLRVRVARDVEGEDLPGDIEFSRGIPKRVVTEGEPIYSVVTNDEEAFELGTSVMELKLRAVMCVPLVSPSDDVIGAVYVDSKAGAREFTELDLSLFRSLAHQVTVALERVRSQEMESSLRVAEEIQKYLLSKTEVEVEGLDVQAFSRPCDKTNGDYLDLFRLDGEKLAVVVGDVTGHGIGPALLVARTQAFLESYVEQGLAPGEVVSRLNNVIESHTKDENFVTLFYSEIDPANRRLSYSSAGHPPALLVRGDGQVEELVKTGVPLGIQPDFPFRMNSDIAFESGDTLFVYTDGLTEAMDSNREMFGPERLRDLLVEQSGSDAETISKTVLERVTEHLDGAPPDDDLTWAVVRRT